MALLGQYYDIVFLIARLIVGITFIYYGWPKIKDLKNNAEDFNKMGFKPGWLFGTGIAVLEFFGGLLLVIGLFVDYVSVLFALHMLTGTIWKITSTDKEFPDWSYDVLLLALALLLAI